MIDYLTIKTAINKIKHKITKTEQIQTTLFKDMSIEVLKRKKIYELLKVDEPCHCEIVWEKKFGIRLNELTWSQIFSSSKETKLQEFQWKVVHNIFPTNILLNRMGLKQSEKCDFCGETEFIEHLFYDCQRLGQLWQKVENMIRINSNIDISLNKYNVILGIEQDEISKTLNKKEIAEVNELLMIAKFCISKSKVMETNLEITFENELRIRNKKQG